MSADRHLLFGLLALQNDFIDKAALVAAFGIWVADRQKSLDRILVEQSALTEDLRMLLEKLVDQHVRARGGDLHASLNSISGNNSVRAELENLADEDLQASIAQLKPHDPYATATVGQSTSQGTRFEIRRPLDRGGLGGVSVAIDRELNREVALKEIRTDRADESSYRQKFLFEAEVTGGLEHPNIVPVYGLGTYSDGRPYYAMRLIQGDNLREHIKAFHQDVQQKRIQYDGPTLRKLLRRFLDICEAIDYAHARGILHRDLKPGNVMLGKYGETLVVDWGLAKSVRTGAAQVIATNNGTKGIDYDLETPLIPSGSSGDETKQGTIIGTAAYAPPEQLSGRVQDVGVRSDVYGLGAILYELLTGQTPGSGKTLEEIMRNVLRGRITSPRTALPQVPEPLQAICLKALSLVPRDRYASASELRQDVERWLDDLPVDVYREPIAIRMLRWIRSHRTIAATATAVVLMLTAGLTLYSSLVRRSNIRLESLNQDLDSKNAQLIESNARERQVANELEVRRRELERERLELKLHNAYLDCENGRFEIGLTTMVQVLRNAVASNDIALERRIRRLIAAWSSEAAFCFPIATTPRKFVQGLPFLANYNAISADSRYLAHVSFDTAADTSFIRLFALDLQNIAANGPELKFLQEWKVDNLRSNLDIFGPNKTLAFADDRQLTFIDVADQISMTIELPPALRPAEDEIVFIKYHERRGRLVVATQGEIQELDLASGKWSPISQEKLAWGQAIAFALSQSEPLGIAVASTQGVFFWEPKSENGLVKIVNDNEVFSLDFDTEGSRLFAGGAGDSDDSKPNETGWYHGWDVSKQVGQQGQAGFFGEIMKRRTSVGHVSVVRTMPHSHAILVASGENLFHDSPNQLQVASIEKDSLVRSVTTLENTALLASSVGVVPRGHYTTMAIGGEKGATLWRIGVRTRLLAEQQLSGDISCAAFDSTGETLFIGLNSVGEGETALQWRRRADLEPNAPLTNRRLGRIRAVLFDPESRQVFWTGESTGSYHVESNKLTVISRNAQAKQNSAIALVNQGQALAVLVDEDASWILGSTPTGKVSINDLASGRAQRKLELSKTILQSLAVGPSGALITGCSDHTVRHWDTASGQENAPVERFVAPVKSVIANETSPVFGVVTADGALHLLRWNENSSYAKVLQHESFIECACLSSDGTLVATGCADGTALLWDTQTGERIGPAMLHKDPVKALAISPDARTLFTAAGNRAMIWEVPSEGTESVATLANRMEMLTGISIDDNGEEYNLAAEQRLKKIELGESAQGTPLLWPE